MSKRKTMEKRRAQRDTKAVEVKNVHYGTERLVDCMKAVIRIHMDSGLAAAGGGYGQEW